MNPKLLPVLVFVAIQWAGCTSSPPPYARRTLVPLPVVSTPPTVTEILRRATTEPVTPFAGEGWRDLFDGKSLKDWRVTEFEEDGNVKVQQGLLVFLRGEPFVGVNGTAKIPKVNYEIAFDAMRLAGDDFFCGLTFPVRDSFCSLIVGGWGGGLVGLSNLDGEDASENETTQFVSFETGRWYRIRLRVSEQKIEAWIAQKKVVDLITTGRKLSLHFGEIELSQPFGLASWETSAAYRAIKIRNITGPGDPTQ